MKQTLGLLDPRISETVRQRGFEELSEVQERAVPEIAAGNHVLVIAPTGTGKTESAMLPVFDALLNGTGPGIRALYITPLRSLNRDILGRLQWWCKELGISVGVRHGDTTQAERRRQALSPPDLLITTPETVQALFTGKRLVKHLEQVRYVIVDEVHELAGSKRGAQLSVALERLVERAGEFQRIALSATVGNPDEVGRFLCGDRPFSLVQIPVAPRLDLAVDFAGTEFADQAAWVAGEIDSAPSTLVFVNTRATAEALGHQLIDRGDVEVHHGSLSREIRVDAEERFRNHEIKALIATSSMELGIDIGHIEHVIQFGSPREVARLVQRAGRAGHRMDARSRATVLATGFDDLAESWVIAKRARAGECEPVVVPVNAADVMANQVAAIALEYGEVPVSRVLSIFERSACFSDCERLLQAVCRQLAGHRLIRLEGDTITRVRRSLTYLSTNLSMIHDEKKAEIYDIVSRRTVGTLDESYVVAWLHTGAAFITKGQLWRVVDMEGGRIFVEPAKQAQGELPTWEGEQIPVPFAVAREAGALRRTGDPGPYLASPGTAAYFERYLREARESGVAIPSDEEITVEQYDEGVIVNCCAGHRVNETLARVFSILLSARYGSSVGIEIGAYRINLRLPIGIGAVDVADLIRTLEPSHIRGILALALKRTALFKWKLVQVAKKFGAIDADADFERISIHRLLDSFDATVVQDEAFRELFTGYLDVEGAAAVVAKVRDGEIRVTSGRLSRFGSEGLSSSRDMVPPPGEDAAVIATLKRRLENDRVLLFCMHCREYKSLTQVSRVPERPECPRCGARLIAALKPWEEDQVKLVQRKKQDDEGRTAQQRLLRNANLVLSSGKKAVIALAARGVGPETASRIIGTWTEGDAFYREIMKAERTYIRTHRFW